MSGLGMVFMSAFASSTLLPGGSEVVLAVMTLTDQYNPWLLLAIASMGNTLGGMWSWGIGRLAGWKYPLSVVTEPKTQRAIRALRRWGSPILFLSWVPVVGDPLCVGAGWIRIHWRAALLWISLGKTARYAVIVFMSAADLA